MIKVEIDQKSLQRTIRDLDKLSNKKHKEAEKIVEKAAVKISNEAKTKHNFTNRTGNLQASIHVESINNTGGNKHGSLNESFLGNLGRNIGSALNYSQYIHDGTSKIKADPYLQRPFYKFKSKMMQELKKLVSKRW